MNLEIVSFMNNVGTTTEVHDTGTCIILLAKFITFNNNIKC